MTNPDLRCPGTRPPGLRLHPRTMKVQSARLAIRESLDEHQEEFELTDIEMHGVVLEYLLTMNKYWLRAERHPDDPDRKADEE